MRRWLVIVAFVDLAIVAGLGVGWFAEHRRAVRNVARYHDFQRRVMDHIPVQYLTHVTLGEFE